MSPEHYVESFVTDSGEFGWQCFTCGREEGGLADFATAEIAADQHRLAATEGEG